MWINSHKVIDWVKAHKSTKSTMTKATAAATFKTNIGPLNTAIAAMGTQAGTWTNSTPASVAKATINPAAVAAVTKAETEFNQRDSRMMSWLMLV